MPFPDTPDFVYKNNPLAKVVCQVQFPPILKIDTELPSIFQDSIRDEYPSYNELPTFQANFPFPLQPEQLVLSAPSIGVNQRGQIPQEILRRLTQQGFGKNHEFSSIDKIWKVILNRNSLSITTSKYTNWNEFKTKFQKPFDAIILSYKPLLFTRIELRYIDIFDRSHYNLDNTPWSELITPGFIGLLSSKVEAEIKNYSSVNEIKLTDEMGSARISTSLAQRLPDKTQCFIIDTTFYLEKQSGKDDVMIKLDFYRNQATKLIRFMVTEKLHNAMVPKYE